MRGGVEGVLEEGVVVDLPGPPGVCARAPRPAPRAWALLAPHRCSSLACCTDYYRALAHTPHGRREILAGWLAD